MSASPVDSRPYRQYQDYVVIVSGAVTHSARIYYRHAQEQLDKEKTLIGKIRVQNGGVAKDSEIRLIPAIQCPLPIVEV